MPSDFNYDDFSFHFPEKSTLNIYNNKLQRKNKLIQKIYFKESSIQLDSINNKSGLSFPKLFFKDSVLEYWSRFFFLLLRIKYLEKFIG